MRDFKLAQPGTVDELAAVLSEGPGAMTLMSGGTDLIDLLKSGVAAPDIVVDVQGIAELAGITRDKDGLRVGPMTRVVDLAAHPDVSRDYPVLKDAALSLASPQLRNVGTVGGNLCQRPRCWYFRDPEVVCLKKGGDKCYAFQGRNQYHAIFGGDPCFIVYPSDLAPALISLGARVTIGRAGGDRVVPLEKFYQPPSVDVRKENILAGDEFIRSVSVPPPRPGQKSGYVKLTERAAWDFALASAAVTGVVRGKVFSEIAIVMGGVGTVPWRMTGAEAVLRGKTVTEALLDQAGRAAVKEAAPLAENAYKINLTAAAIRKAVSALV
jgi:xanthine dehydrogenase YagS FAD-binding subunit